MIVYEVRFLAGSAKTFGRFMGEKPRLANQEAGCSAWVIDQKTLGNWLNRARQDRATKVAEVPKITAFEEASATVLNGQKLARGSLKYLESSDLKIDPPATPNTQSSRAKVKVKVSGGGFVGSKLEVRGKILPESIRLSVDVFDSSLVSDGEQQVKSKPAIIERKSHAFCDLPTDSYLAICLDLPQESVVPYTATGPVAGVEPPVAMGPGSSERRVLYIVRARQASAEAAALRNASATLKSDTKTR